MATRPLARPRHDDPSPCIRCVPTGGVQSDSEFDKEKCLERVAKLGGAIGRIKVGAATETELKDKKLRYEDALNSVKAAMDEGIVPGGGATLVYMLRTKEKVLAGIEDEDERLAYAAANERDHKPPRCVRVCAVPPSC